jgi:hypothetical protein
MPCAAWPDSPEQTFQSTELAWMDRITMWAVDSLRCGGPEVLTVCDHSHIDRQPDPETACSLVLLKIA